MRPSCMGLKPWPEVRIAFLDGGDKGDLPWLDEDELGLGGGDLGDLRDGDVGAVVVDLDLVEHMDAGATGAGGEKVGAEVVDGLFHAGFQLRVNVLECDDGGHCRCHRVHVLKRGGAGIHSKPLVVYRDARRRQASCRSLSFLAKQKRKRFSPTGLPGRKKAEPATEATPVRARRSRDLAAALRADEWAGVREDVVGAVGDVGGEAGGEERVDEHGALAEVVGGELGVEGGR